jgi:hypothetical protein
MSDERMEAIANETTVALAIESTAAVQVNDHDAEVLRKQVAGIATEIMNLGYRFDMDAVRASAESYAVMRLLVVKGVCTDAEAQVEVYSRMRGMLAATLQQVEEQILKDGKQRVQPVRTPGLVVATH